jgi:uncharacterized membrane protein YjjP (DUF1212 family)
MIERNSETSRWWIAFISSVRFCSSFLEIISLGEDVVAIIVFVAAAVDILTRRQWNMISMHQKDIRR